MDRARKISHRSYDGPRIDLCLVLWKPSRSGVLWIVHTAVCVGSCPRKILAADTGYPLLLWRTVLGTCDATGS